MSSKPSNPKTEAKGTSKADGKGKADAKGKGPSAGADPVQGLGAKVLMIGKLKSK